MKRYKVEKDGVLEVGQIMYTKKYIFSLDRQLCKGCQLCMLVCPRNAVSIIPQEDVDGQAVASKIDINENICDFHGICAVVCPFSAIKISVNGDETLNAVKMEVFPTLTRDISIDTSLCEEDCTTCEEVCPLGIMSVTKNDGKTEVDVKTELCASCRVCWDECPSQCVDVSKFIEGSIQINSEHCPEGCTRCLDVCPLDAIDIDDDDKVYAKNLNCIYCGACKTVCPNDEALTIVRTALLHSPVSSGAWNKGLEKLTSTAGLMRELAAERNSKLRTTVQSLERTEESE
ncbi:MAG: 4Fe-4S dicluster domain-containing protein [Oscillospiraceae bacterium]|nr:4Fe-4S dicluster domain-containing protein [Oscillospiraceae bacterium]